MTTKARRGAQAVVEATKVDVGPGVQHQNSTAPAAEAAGSLRRRGPTWFHWLIYGACYVVAAMVVTLLVDAWERYASDDE